MCTPSVKLFFILQLNKINAERVDEVSAVLSESSFYHSPRPNII